MKISIIIPTLNEEKAIGQLVSSLVHKGKYIAEVVVADGGSRDDTVKLAEKAGARTVHVPNTGRAIQMNAGANAANGDIFYFLHADTFPPANFDKIILEAVSGGADAGCFRLQFDSNHPLLSFYAWFTRFKVDAFRFGDQSLFVTQKAFNQIGGFDEKMNLMEDFDIIKRLKKSFNFKLLNSPVVTSARRYNQNGVIKLQIVFILIFSLYQMGVSQKVLQKIYTLFIKSEKPG